jgi:putative transposase
VVLEREDQLVVNRKAVQRHMREMGIAGVRYPEGTHPNLSRRANAHRIHPYLLRGVVASHPNHVWQIDITYLRLTRSWMFLVAVLDVYARYIVSWALAWHHEESYP